MLLNDKFSLEAMLDAVDKIQRYSAKYNNPKDFYNTVEFEASVMNFIILAEMVDRLSDEIKSEYPDVSWKSIKGFRNIAAHDYFGLDLDEVWDIIQNYLPRLQQNITEILIEIER
jgi:uncharacterized protein with HEPN domain